MTMVLDIENLLLVDPGDKLGHAIVAITAALVARGWVVRGSGDGAAAFQNLEQTAGPYNVFTSGVGYVAVSAFWNAAAPNTISKPRAWIRLKEPGSSTREIIFQRSNNTAVTGENGLIVRIAIGGYTGSGATALSPPAAPGGDALILGTAFNGAGLTNMFPTGSAQPGFSVMTNRRTKYLNAMISDSVRAGNVWPIHFWMVDATDNTRDNAFIYESLIDLTDVDLEPWVAVAGVYVNVFQTLVSVNIAGPALTGYMAGVVTAMAWGYYTFGAGTYPGGTGPDPNPSVGGDGKLRAPHVWVTTTLSTYGAGGVMRGRLEHIIFNPLEQSYSAVIDPATAGALVCHGRLLLPWKINTTPAY